MFHMTFKLTTVTTFFRYTWNVVQQVQSIVLFRVLCTLSKFFFYFQLKDLCTSMSEHDSEAEALDLSFIGKKTKKKAVDQIDRERRGR